MNKPLLFGLSLSVATVFLLLGLHAGLRADRLVGSALGVTACSSGILGTWRSWRTASFGCRASQAARSRLQVTWHVGWVVVGLLQVVVWAVLYRSASLVMIASGIIWIWFCAFVLVLRRQ